jgi:2-polyprenyl-6-methoxyphenol hydroxylase-like FAD-dependent oxidoreductase
MSRSTLNEALVDKAWCEGVEMRFEKKLVAIEDHPDQPVVAHFADGSSAEGDFLIGADGVHSAVRAHVIPDGPTPFDTGLIGFGGFVPRSVLEGHPIGQRVETTFGQSGFFGYGFCGPDPDAGVMWWSTQPSHGIDAATFRGMNQQALKRHLLEFHAGWHDPIPQLLQATENIGVTATLDVATLPTWSRQRTLLIGDAAHATSPHAGQGASLALEDAMRFGRLLQEGDDLRAIFEKFEGERRPRAERVVAVARRNGNSKREFSAAGAWIRDRMLKLLLPVSARGMDWMYAYDPRAMQSSHRAAQLSRRAA